MDAETGGGGTQFGVEFVVGVVQPVQVGQAYAGDMDFVVFVHQQLSAAAEDKFHFLQLGGAQVVVFVAAQLQHFAHPVLGKAEGAGAVGLAEPVPGIGCYVFLVKDKAGGVG